MYYKFSLPFAVIGLWHLIREAGKKKEFAYEVFVLIQLAGAILVGCLIDVNINRINAIHLWIVVLIALGVYDVGHYLGKKIGYAVKLVYGIAFVAFVSFYFTSYADNIAIQFQDGLGEVVEYAMENSEDIYVHSNISYAKVMYYSQFPVDNYMETVTYVNYPSMYLSVDSFGPFRFFIDYVDTGERGAYILPADSISREIAEEYSVYYAGNYGCVLVE